MTATITRISRSDTWRRAFIAQHGARCHYCNRSGSLDEGPGHRPWHVDHMNPLARGGADDEENLALACKRCNLTKSAQQYGVFKRFARLAWWQDRDGIDEGTLDSIMHVWERSAGETWWLGLDENGRTQVVSADEGGPAGTGAVPLFGAIYGDKTADRGMEFAVAAHEIIPDLVAEIRQLRADLRGQEAAA